MKKHSVVLTAEQRRGLLERIAAGKSPAQRLSHSRILRKADASAGGPGWTDEKIASSRERKLDGVGEAYLLALAGSQASEDRVCWSMQLLAEKLVALQVVESICDESVWRTPKK